MQILKNILLLRHEPLSNTHFEVVINRAKFNACTSSSLRGVKTDSPTDTQTDRFAFYGIDQGWATSGHFVVDVPSYAAAKINTLF